MTAPMNMALYRLLLKGGATEAEAEDAARLDTATLATRADLAELRGEMTLLKWMLGANTALVLLVLGRVWFP